MRKYLPFIPFPPSFHPFINFRIWKTKRICVKYEVKTASLLDSIRCQLQTHRANYPPPPPSCCHLSCITLLNHSVCAWSPSVRSSSPLVSSKCLEFASVAGIPLSSLWWSSGRYLSRGVGPILLHWSTNCCSSQPGLLRRNGLTLYVCVYLRCCYVRGRDREGEFDYTLTWTGVCVIRRTIFL